MTAKSPQSLEEKLQSFVSPVEMLREAQVGPYVFPIQAEFSNWRDEQEAWHKTAVLFDLSRHMTDIYFEGPDLIRLLTDLAVNSFRTFRPHKAKQLVCCNREGYVIGDAILFGLSENRVNISGRPSVPNWVAYNAETGDYDVTVSRDDRSVQNRGARRTYRFQIQGPNAAIILEAATGGPLPDIKFFNIGELVIAGKKVSALNHGMARTQGLELFGPAEDAGIVRSAVLDSGEAHGLRQVGARAYSSGSIESGGIPAPMPAIFSGDAMKPYREWLPADGFEANASLGGSYYSQNIEDYYQTPWDLGYGMHVKFDHDFIGREALERMADRSHRKKVWLVWDDADVVRIFSSTLGNGDRFKYLEVPGSQYSTLPFDKVLSGGSFIGFSTYNVYTSNVRAWFSLAMIDEAHAVAGKEVTILWGEEGGGSSKPAVERHVQTEVRATIHIQRPGPQG